MKNFLLRLAALEFWIVALVVGASFVYVRLLPVAAGVAVLFWPIRRLAYGRWGVRTPLDWPVLGLLCLVPVTVWATAFPELTLPQVYRLLSGIGLFYATVNWANSLARLRLVVRGMVLAGFLLALFSLVSVEWNVAKMPFIPQSIYSHLHVLVSDVVNTNVMAGSLVIIWPLALALLLFAGRQMHWPELVWTGLVAAVMLVMLVLTQSRGAYLAAAGIVVLLIGLRWRWGWLLVALIVIGVGTTSYFWGWSRAVTFLTAGTSATGADGRIELWSRGIFMVQDFSFTGVGMGSYGPVADLLYPFFLYPPGRINHVHNLFLQVAIDLGIPGLVMWMATWMLVIILAWQVYRRGRARRDRWLEGVGAGLLASQVALGLHGLLDGVTWGIVRSAPLVWVLWGLVVGQRIVNGWATDGQRINGWATDQRIVNG